MLVPNPSPSRAARPAILTAIVVLAVLTVIGTAPAPTSDGGQPVASGQMADGRMSSTSTAVEGGDQTFAEIFDEMRSPEPELGGGEGQQSVVSVADQGSALPPPLPGQAPAEASTSPPVSAVLPDVDPVRPVLTVTGVDAAAAQDLTEVPGVAAAAAAVVAEVHLDVPGGSMAVTVAAVDPIAFRPLTPPVTAEESAVWQRIIAGDAAFTHDAGNRVPVPLGSSVEVRGSGEALRIGAYASNGIPSVADALVSTDRLGALGLDGETTIYVAIEDGADPSQVQEAIAAVSTGVVEPIEEPEEQQAFLTGSAAAEFFEPFSYVDHGDGLITIDPSWVARNIETRRLPIFTGNVTCHRQMLVQLEGALREVEAAGLAPLIDTTDYGGCWVARHIDWRPDRPLSMHAWGLAVDFNVRTNGLGQTPTMDPRIVEIFDRWGFVWGGRWSRPDGMHFELGAVLQGPAAGTLGVLSQ